MNIKSATTYEGLILRGKRLGDCEGMLKRKGNFIADTAHSRSLANFQEIDEKTLDTMRLKLQKAMPDNKQLQNKQIDKEELLEQVKLFVDQSKKRFEEQKAELLKRYEITHKRYFPEKER